MFLCQAIEEQPGALYKHDRAFGYVAVINSGKKMS